MTQQPVAQIFKDLIAVKHIHDSVIHIVSKNHSYLSFERTSNKCYPLKKRRKFYFALKWIKTVPRLLLRATLNQKAYFRSLFCLLNLFLKFSVEFKKSIVFQTNGNKPFDVPSVKPHLHWQLFALKSVSVSYNLGYLGHRETDRVSLFLSRCPKQGSLTEGFSWPPCSN